MRRFVKKSISMVLAGITAMSLAFNVPAPTKVSAASDVTVNLSSTKQYIRGFGASSAWCGAINDSVMNSLYGDLGYSILRLRIEEGIGDNWKTGNFSKWAAELSNAKKASAKGAIVFASPWNPPSSMQESFYKSGDSDAKRLRYDKYTEYTQYLNAYVKYMKDNGVNLYAISIQNEPDYANDWTWWTPQEMLNFMKNNAGTINCKVIAPESFQFLKNMSDPILNDSTALSNVDVIGCHLYGTPVSNFSYPLFAQKGAGKELWMTEHYFDDDNTSTLMNMATEIHDCMVTGNMNAYVYWWITWANGLGTSSGQIYKRAYVLGQFAKYIRPGYYRVDATATPNTNVYVSAYKGDNKVVIVAINKGTSAVNQKFNISNGTTSKVSTYITDSSRNMAASSSINVSGGSFSAQLPAQSITTFVGDLGSINTDSVSAFNKVEAENYSDQSGIQTETCSDTNGGQDVGYIENGDYVKFANVDFGTGASSFMARVASATSGGNIEIHLDSLAGTQIGTCEVPETGGWQTWTDATCNVNGVSGKHDVYLKFTGGSGYLMNFNWWKFNNTATTPTVKPTIAPTVAPTITPTVAPTVAPTVIPTVIPTVKPTTTPVSGAVPEVTVTSTIGGSVSQNYIIKSSSATQPIDLSKVTLRYYYDKTGTKDQTFICDSAGLSLNTSPYYVNYASSVKGTLYNGYLEISFADAYLLSDGSLSLGIRFNQSDWSSYENFIANKLEIIYNGVVVNSQLY